jgi:hypothetical protein
MFFVIMRRNAAERSYEEEGSRRRDNAESNIAHATTDALTLSGHARRTPSGCKSGDIKRTIIKRHAVPFLEPTRLSLWQLKAPAGRLFGRYSCPAPAIYFYIFRHA